MQIFWLSLFEKKSSSPVSNLWGFGSFINLGGYEEKPMNFNTYYDMYLRNADVKSCVNEVSKTAWKSWFALQKKWKIVNWEQQWENEPNNQFVSAFLNNSVKLPNALDDWAAFNMLKKEILKNYKISWNVFALKKFNTIGKLSGIKVLDTRHVSIITTPEHEVLYYMVRIGWTVIQVPPQNMFHFVSTDSVADEVYGESELSGVIYHAYADNEASIANYFSMLNNSVPAWLYVLKDGIPVDQAQKIVEDVKKEVRGSKNRNKSLVSNAIQDFKQLAQNHKDMDFVAMQEFNSEKICSALWVPRVILNYTNKVQVWNGETQYKKYIENTIRPIEFDLSCMFTIMISEIVPDRYFQIIDNHINDKLEKIELSEKMVKNGLWNRNEAREYLGEGMVDKNDTMNEYTIDSNVKLLTDVEFNLNDVIQTPPDANQ